MKNDNIFTEDVVVPKIVREKAGNAFLTIKTERDCEMNKMGKSEQSVKDWGQSGRLQERRRRRGAKRRIIAAAACMAVVIAAGVLAGLSRGLSKRQGGEGALFNAVDEIEKMFILQVKAAEPDGEEMISLTEDQPVPLAMPEDRGTSWVLGSDEGESVVDYCINVPRMICEGSNIESITYRINRGAFQIVQPENEESIIVDGQLFDGTLNTGSIGGDYDEGRGGEPSRPFETVCYQTFTLDYNRQSDEYTWINICGQRPDSEEIVQLIWGDGRTNEDYCKGIQKMLDDTVITCTVNYTDQTSKSVDIKVGSCTMTRKESGERLDPAMDPKELEEETTVITFELQKQEDER